MGGKLISSFGSCLRIDKVVSLMEAKFAWQSGAPLWGSLFSFLHRDDFSYFTDSAWCLSYVIWDLLVASVRVLPL